MNKLVLKIDIDTYFVVRHKVTDRFYAVKKVDNPVGDWDKNLDEPVKCYLISTDGYIDSSFEYEYSRRDLDKEIWLEVR